jgi:hypothetical protein
MKLADESDSDAKRADLLRWLLDSHPDVDLSAVNARLQTPAHCAVTSHSLGVLEVETFLILVAALAAQQEHGPADGEPQRIAHMTPWSRGMAVPSQAALGTLQCL